MSHRGHTLGSGHDLQYASLQQRCRRHTSLSMLRHSSTCPAPTQQSLKTKDEGPPFRGPGWGNSPEKCWVKVQVGVGEGSGWSWWRFRLEVVKVQVGVGEGSGWSSLHKHEIMAYPLSSPKKFGNPQVGCIKDWNKHIRHSCLGR